MQTFLPYPDFRQSARVLDRERLGKQRVEASQIIDTLEGRSKGWVNHPAVKMWEGYTDTLKHYCNCCIEEWSRRKYKNNMELYVISEIVTPWWLGKNLLHSSHRAALLYKNFDFYYTHYQWTEIPSLNYWWPV